jgi:hypothetical protein
MSKEETQKYLTTNLLNQQLQDVHSFFLVCKWPVTLTSCFFITLLCWEMAGDHGGWDRALWVPVVGLVLVLIIWIWDRTLVNGTISFDKAPLFDSPNCDLMPNSVELLVTRSTLHHSITLTGQGD